MLSNSHSSNVTDGANDVNGHHKPDAQNGALTVLICGAGIAGLTAAIALRQQGHIVEIFEQSQFAQELGAAIHLAPNSNGVLRRLGIYAEKFGSVVANRFTEIDENGNVVRNMDLRTSSGMWQHPWHLAHRVHLHDALKQAATSIEGKGVPCKLHTRSRIRSIDEENGVVFLENGNTIHGDVIVGADGVHSVTRTAIAPNTKPFGCGQSAFRFLISRDLVKSDPVTAPLVDEEGEMKIWYTNDRRIVMYPTSNQQLLNFNCIHPASESNASPDFNTEASLGTLQKVYSNMLPEVQALIAKADQKTLKCWTLLDMDEIPVWNKERLALIGDAAHPFLPHQGQGAGTAIEDAAALATVLPLGTKRGEVAERLRLYDDIRHERATKIQYYSRIIGGDDLLKKKEINMMKFSAYNFGHDEFDNSAQRFREYLWSKGPQKYCRMPLAFGPMPGPRQDHYGHPRSGKDSTFVTASIRFKTSRTALQNLFPPGRAGYKFQSPGTVAYASFSQTTLNGMAWLGGSGYNHLGLYVHGVEYESAEGKKVSGTYLPVLFENLADPIVSGREELGMPKVFSAIDVHRRESSYHIKTSWQGVNWGTFSLPKLEPLDPATASGSLASEAGDGVIVHRYIPAVGSDRKGQAEADYACFDAFADTQLKPEILRAWKAKSATFELEAGDAESLPTLHHIIERLRELPVYEIVEAKVVEGRGVADVSGLRRV